MYLWSIVCSNNSGAPSPKSQYHFAIADPPLTVDRSLNVIAFPAHEGRLVLKFATGSCVKTTFFVAISEMQPISVITESVAK